MLRTFVYTPGLVEIVSGAEIQPVQEIGWTP